jgi:hypothetical protein
MDTTTKTREEWLRWGVDELRPRFADGGYPLPQVHVSVGFPSSGGKSAKRRVIGECWQGSASSDGKAHIFISPVLVTGADALDPAGARSTSNGRPPTISAARLSRSRPRRPRS